MSSTRDALEAALAADPDDLARHAAYADLLIEESDPRGEFIRLQLALEDPELPEGRRRAMDEAANELLRRHEAEWLGPLAQYVVPEMMASTTRPGNVTVGWKRGWIEHIQIIRLSRQVASALVNLPNASLIRKLSVHANRRGWGDFMPEVRGLPSRISLDIIPDTVWMSSLTELTLGTEQTARHVEFDDDLERLLKRCPSLERLSISVEMLIPSGVFDAPLTRLESLEVVANTPRLPMALLGTNQSLRALKRLRLDLAALRPNESAEYGWDRDSVYPDECRALFASPNLSDLRELSLHLPGFADEGVAELIASGLVPRLTHLDLSRCDITDDGAEALAACPDTARLESIVLDDNLLTPIGIHALAAVGITVGPQQWDAGRGREYV